MPPPLLYDLSTFDENNPVFDLEAIREINPQRFEMEQLTAILHVDTEMNGVVGFKDISENEFWARGHMPGYPIMPGIVICECMAQLAGFYARKFDLLGGDYIGFGGMDKVRFRAPVYPNSRLFLMAQCVSMRARRLATFQFQGIVNGEMVASGEMIGAAINRI